MNFTVPVALLLLFGLPLIVWLGWPRVRFRRTRDVLSLLIRSLLYACLVLALAGAQIARGADKLSVVFLVDASDSISTAGRDSQLEYLRASLAAMTPDDQAAVVVFGSDALIDRPLSAVRDLTALRSSPVTSATDLEEAISLALALFPSDAAQRIIVLSDGAQTVGDAAAAASRAAATGVEISIVPIIQPALPEIRVTNVRAPETVSAGQFFDLGITVQSDTSAQADLTVLAGSAVVYRESVALDPGVNTFALTLQAGDAGFRDFRVQLEPESGADAFVQNNQLAAFSRVIGAPNVLLVAQDEGETDALSEALTTLGFTVDRVRPSGLPSTVVGLESYDSVIMANVPALRLSQQRMQTLQSYVRDLGGGLVVIGGPESYAAGGYFQTPLEESLPVEMRISDQQRLPMLTINYVIDRSGSMGTILPGNVSALELAKEAIIRSIDFLQPTDRAGIIGFDTDGLILAETQPVLNRIGLQTLVGTLGAGGGTDILAGMRLAAEQLADDPAPRKHIILLTDGGSDPAGLIDLTLSLNRDSDVTTSVISIGGGPEFLREMAEVGGGNYHEVSDVSQIPTIFTQETVLATRSYIIEGAFVPTIFANNPILEGITAAPPLYGYVASTPRQTAQVILRGNAPYFDPILAGWQYGLGRSIAFTSDATGRWGADWVTWDDFARFWSQAVEWTITEEASQNLETRIAMTGETARITVDARDDAGEFANGLLLNARVVPPDGSEAFTVPVRQTAPGQYEADFVPPGEGAYLVRLFGENQTGESLDTTAGWVMSYSPEYSAAGLSDGRMLLAALAAQTGGRDLTTEPSAAFLHNLQSRAGFTPAWPFLLLIAALLLPIDIAVRRLLITSSDLQRARAAVFGTGRASQATESRMSQLRQAKQRAETSRATGEVPASRPAESTAPRESGPLRPAAPTAPRSGSGSTASELLKRKKRDRDESA
ncbi:MAG: VWA domain-containing protein [Pleurocapsa minor GSE-CHR-MK-17-07R]|jgi:uncharacterized membrane protein|nr:VWA domain-containing protein [Pleurocapsa minor GSE-CHR-MK 17-07R]